jgi:DNA-binding NarL/FixJ family response regulator
MTPIPAKIVIVDDHRGVRQTLRALLAREPHWRVYDVESGAVALDLIRQIHPHVALLDLVMPDMNGVELAVEIRQLENAPKIVLMSSHFDREEATVLARLFGDGNFVPKSEAGISLIPAINRLLPEECQAQGASA